MKGHSSEHVLASSSKSSLTVMHTRDVPRAIVVTELSLTQRKRGGPLKIFVKPTYAMAICGPSLKHVCNIFLAQVVRD